MQFLRQLPSVLVKGLVRNQLRRAPQLSRYYSSDSPTLPGHSQVVICGGGIVGCSVAYPLAKLGWTDIVLLEQGRYEVKEVGLLVYILPAINYYCMCQ